MRTLTIIAIILASASAYALKLEIIINVKNNAGTTISSDSIAINNTGTVARLQSAYGSSVANLKDGIQKSMQERLRDYEDQQATKAHMEALINAQIEAQNAGMALE